MTSASLPTQPLGRKLPTEIKVPTGKGFPTRLSGEEPACRAGDPGPVPGWGRAPGGHGNHSSVLPWRIPWTEEPGGRWATVHGVTKSRTRLGYSTTINNNRSKGAGCLGLSAGD